MFHYVLSDDRKQDAATNTSHSNRLIERVKEQNWMKSTISTIWENNDGFAEQYRCASAL